MAAGSASSTVKSKNNQTKNKLTRQKSTHTPTTPSPKKYTTTRRRRFEKQPTYNENEISLIIPGVHKGVKVDWNKGGRRKITRATPIKRAQNRSKSNSPERKRKKKEDNEPQPKEKKLSPKRPAKPKPSATSPKTRKKATKSPDLKRINKANNKTKSKKENEKTSLSKTPPTKTSPAKKSPAKTSPAKTKTPPVKSSPRKSPTKNQKSVSPKSKSKVNPRSPHVRRTACLNAGAILSAIYEPIRPKSNASSIDSALAGKREPEEQKAKRGRPKEHTTKTSKKLSKKKDTDDEMQLSSQKTVDSSEKDGNDSGKKPRLKSRKDSKDKIIEKSKKKSPGRKKKVENNDQEEIEEVTKKEKKGRKRKQPAETVVIDDRPTVKRMASLNATAILQAAYKEEESPTDSSKGKKKGKVSQSERSSSSSEQSQGSASLTTSCTAVMVVSTRPSASVQPRQQAPQPIVPYVPTPLGSSSRLQRPPVHAFSFASNSQCFTAPSVAAQPSSDIRPTFSLFNVPVHGAPVYDQISPCPQLRQRLYVQQQQQCWPQPLPFIRHDMKTNTTLTCAFRPIAPQRHIVQRLGSAVQPHSHLVVGNILPTPHSVATPIQLQPRISPKPPSPVKQTPTTSTSASKQSSKGSSSSGKSTKSGGKRQSGGNDGSTPKRRPPEDNGSRKQCKWQWIGEPNMKMIPSHHAPLPTKSSNGMSSCGTSPNTPHNSPMQLVKRKCYTAIQHKDGDIVRIRDCVLVKANRRKASAPFIAKVAALWEDENSGEMMMSILWYYRPEQTEASHIPPHHKSEVFASRHADIANVQTIDDICHVLTKAQFCRFKKEQERLRVHIPHLMAVVPPGESSVKMPDVNASPDTVFLCCRVYDVRAKRILKHPPRVAVDNNSTPPSSSSSEEK